MYQLYNYLNITSPHKSTLKQMWSCAVCSSVILLNCLYLHNQLGRMIWKIVCIRTVNQYLCWSMQQKVGRGWDCGIRGGCHLQRVWRLSVKDRMTAAIFLHDFYMSKAWLTIETLLVSTSAIWSVKAWFLGVGLAFLKENNLNIGLSFWIRQSTFCVNTATFKALLVN